jgi:hypothetical protein
VQVHIPHSSDQTGIRKNELLLPISVHIPHS